MANKFSKCYECGIELEKAYFDGVRNNQKERFCEDCVDELATSVEKNGSRVYCIHSKDMKGDFEIIME